MKVNYIIAAWDGDRVSANSYSYENVLRKHLAALDKFKHSFEQITIMRPESPPRNTYYDIPLRDNIQVITHKNENLSYGQWLRALELFHKDFDYHILIEDDYVPATDDFDRKLLDMYQEGTYLCSMVGGKPFHCMISNGIISSQAYRSMCHANYERYFEQYDPQRAFSRLLIEHGVECLDYRHRYKVEFYTQDKIINYSILNEGEHIFRPIQRVDL